ncbi:MAG: helix-turn-helix domain-containing protein, partial [Gordonia sp. (in: high G+C Gram-positive bacteria)]
LFGEHGGIDASSAGAYLGVPADETVAVVGLAVGGGASSHAPAMAAIGGALRLQASAFAPSSVSSVLGGRAYLMLPGRRSEASLTRWVRTLVGKFDDVPALAGGTLRAAVAAPVDGLAAVADARREVDRVLDGTEADGDRVATLADSRTAVLLAETLDLVASREELRDPRVALLAEHDSERDSRLLESLRAYLDAHGNVRAAARRSGVHPNTLRYRLDRAQALSGFDLENAADRLLLALQLAVRRRERP